MASYSLETNADETTFADDHISVTIQHARPFGITRLEVPGGLNFAHADFPLADLEYVGVDKQAPTKTLRFDWGVPDVLATPTELELRFRRQAPEPGMTLQTSFRFNLSDGNAAFDVDYTIGTPGGPAVPFVYAMVGLPGFSAHDRIVRVSDTTVTRDSTPFANFRDEAVAGGVPQTVLTYDEPTGSLEGVLVAEDALGCLTATAHVGAGLTLSSSAHVNKPAYLTSHAYLEIPEVAAGQNWVIPVRYEASLGCD